MKLKGLIAAAGLSSRMGDFKPLLEINGFPMIAMTVQSMKNAGIRDITVVVGRKAEEIRSVLKPMQVHFVMNPDYQNTDMLRSVQLGLETMQAAEGICFLPGDMPLVSPAVMGTMKERLNSISKETEVLLPLLGKKQVHPPILLPGSYAKILSWKGEGGMRRVFEMSAREYVSLEDPGTTMDADVRADIIVLRKYARATKGISLHKCENLYKEMYMPENIRRHCYAVGELAAQLAEKLIESGACLDVELCRSGGFLHDLCRLLPHHENQAREYLRKKGYLALGEIVGMHGKFETMPDSICKESVLVCLADKLIRETRRVTIQERYEKAFQYGTVKPAIQKSYQICCLLAKEYEERTGERLYAADLSE